MKFVIFKDDDEADILLNLAHISQIAVRKSRLTGNCFLRLNHANTKNVTETQHINCKEIWKFWNEMTKQINDPSSGPIIDLRNYQDNLWTPNQITPNISELGFKTEDKFVSKPKITSEISQKSL